MAFAKTLKEQQLNIFCDYCFRNITLDTYIRCEECSFDLCPSCFSLGVETSSHKMTHKFRIISNLHLEPESDGWKVIDELLLLDGMLSYGFGNFDDIAKILTEKRADEIKMHFFKLIGIKDDKTGEIDSTSVSKSNPNDSFVLSYMSKRKEFDSEILNEYETLIEDLVFEETDSELETDFKRHLLNNYGMVLKRRKIWRNFILDRNLVNIPHFKSIEKTDLDDIGSKYKWLVQFLSKKDFNLFIAGLIREKELKDILSRHTDLYNIQSDRLTNNSKLLSEKEKTFCKKINITTTLYSKLKKMAIEYYIAKIPLKDEFFDLFNEEDHQRVHIIYKWFLDQNIVHEK